MEIAEEMDQQSQSYSPYILSPNLLDEGWDYDDSGIYIPYTFKYETNPDARDIYLKIERVPDLKTKFIIYSWNYLEDGEYVRLNYFRRDILPVEEEIDSGGKSSINKKLSHTGRIAHLNSDKGVYKSFFESILIDIVNSQCLEVFKEIDYEFPIDDEEDDDLSDDEIEGMSDIINERINPTLTEEQIADAMEVLSLIEEMGLIKYWDSIVDKFHIGNHRTIYRKHLGGVNIIRGKGSYFISSKAKSNVGKSLEDKIAFLIMIPKRYIFKKDQMTLASFSRYSDIDIKFFERMIIIFGDLGSKDSYDKVKDVFDIIKKLITEKEFSRDLTEGNSSNLENKTLYLIAESIGAVYQTVRFDFLGDEIEQIASRSIESTPMEANNDEVLDFLFALKYPDSKESKEQTIALESVKKYHNFLLWIIKEDILIINPYRRFFKRFVKDSDVIYRDFEQMIEIFDAYCVLTFKDCLKIDDKYIASPKQLKEFISEICLENNLPPVESNFIKMILSEENKKSELTIPISDEDFEFSPIATYENQVMEHLGFIKNLDKYEYETINDLEYSKKQAAISKLLEMFRLGGTGTNHKENVFFRVNDISRVHYNKRAFKDIDDVTSLLNKLYSNLYLEKLEYTDNRGRNIYYLTPKCKEIIQSNDIEEDDYEDAIDFLNEQGIEAELEDIKAE